MVVVEVSLWWWWWFVDWVVFAVCVRGGGGLSQAITVGGCCWLWRWYEFFLLVVPGFFCCWICGFVEFWLFLCVTLVGSWDDFVANLRDLGCVNGGMWTVEVVVGGSGGGWGFGFAYYSSESSNDRFVVFFFFWALWCIILL